MNSSDQSGSTSEGEDVPSEVEEDGVGDITFEDAINILNYVERKKLKSLEKLTNMIQALRRSMRRPKKKNNNNASSSVPGTQLMGNKESDSGEKRKRDAESTTTTSTTTTTAAQNTGVKGVKRSFQEEMEEVRQIRRRKWEEETRKRKAETDSLDPDEIKEVMPKRTRIQETPKILVSIVEMLPKEALQEIYDSFKKDTYTQELVRSALRRGIEMDEMMSVEKLLSSVKMTFGGRPEAYLGHGMYVRDFEKNLEEVYRNAVADAIIFNGIAEHTDFGVDSGQLHTDAERITVPWGKREPLYKVAAREMYQASRFYLQTAEKEGADVAKLKMHKDADVVIYAALASDGSKTSNNNAKKPRGKKGKKGKKGAKSSKKASRETDYSEAASARIRYDASNSVYQQCVMKAFLESNSVEGGRAPQREEFEMAHHLQDLGGVPFDKQSVGEWAHRLYSRHLYIVFGIHLVCSLRHPWMYQDNDWPNMSHTPAERLDKELKEASDSVSDMSLSNSRVWGGKMMGRFGRDDFSAWKGALRIALDPSLCWIESASYDPNGGERPLMLSNPCYRVRLIKQIFVMHPEVQWVFYCHTFEGGEAPGNSEEPLDLAVSFLGIPENAKLSISEGENDQAAWLSFSASRANVQVHMPDDFIWCGTALNLSFDAVRFDENRNGSVFAVLADVSPSGEELPVARYLRSLLVSNSYVTGWSREMKERFSSLHFQIFRNLTLDSVLTSPIDEEAAEEFAYAARQLAKGRRKKTKNPDPEDLEKRTFSLKVTGQSALILGAENKDLDVKHVLRLPFTRLNPLLLAGDNARVRLDITPREFFDDMAWIPNPLDPSNSSLIQSITGSFRAVHSFRSTEEGLPALRLLLAFHAVHHDAFPITGIKTALARATELVFVLDSIDEGLVYLRLERLVKAALADESCVTLLRAIRERVAAVGMPKISKPLEKFYLLYRGSRYLPDKLSAVEQDPLFRFMVSLRILWHPRLGKEKKGFPPIYDPYLGPIPNLPHAMILPRHNLKK